MKLRLPPVLLKPDRPVLAFCAANLAVVIAELLLSAAEPETSTSAPKERHESE